MKRLESGRLKCALKTRSEVYAINLHKPAFSYRFFNERAFSRDHKRLARKTAFVSWGIVKGLEGVPLAIGGIEDHVHLLVGLRSKHRLDYFLRDLKVDSSAWIHQELKRKFEWQKGYAAFTVSPSSIEGVKKYILNQEKHHGNKTFKVELVELLEASGIEYDEKYLW